MASPSSVLSMGYGSWGSVNLLPTLGYGTGAVTPPSVPGIEYVWRGDRLHWVWKGDRLKYVWRGDRLHYVGSEEL